MTANRDDGVCDATTGSSFEFDGRTGFPCELPVDGHELHVRTSEPLVTQWRELPGGRRRFGATRLGFGIGKRG